MKVNAPIRKGQLFALSDQELRNGHWFEALEDAVRASERPKLFPNISELRDEHWVVSVTWHRRGLDDIKTVAVFRYPPIILMQQPQN